MQVYGPNNCVNGKITTAINLPKLKSVTLARKKLTIRIIREARRVYGLWILGFSLDLCQSLT